MEVPRNDQTVCLVSAFYPPHLGGVERYAEQMALHLGLQGIRVLVLTTSVSDAPGIQFQENLVILRLPVFRLFQSRFPLPRFLSPAGREITRYLSKTPIRLYVVNVRFYLTSLFGLWLAGKSKAKTIVIEHGTGHVSLGSKLSDFFIRIYEHGVTRFVKIRFRPDWYGVSKASCTWLQHFGIKGKGVIPNSISLQPTQLVIGHSFRNQYSIPDDAVVFSFAGRLIPEKGILEIISIFREFKSKYPNSFLLIAGTGPLTQKIQSFQTHQIRLLGLLNQNQMQTFLNSTDIFLLPSRYPEGLPTILLEAGLAKCAVIATEKGGIPEVISNENQGILLPSLEPSLWFHAMETLYLDADLRKKMQDALHQKVLAQYTWESTIKQFLNLLD